MTALHTSPSGALLRRTEPGVPSSWDLEGLSSAGYRGFISLLAGDLSLVPPAVGTYVVLLPDAQRPRFLAARRVEKPGQRPAESIQRLQGAWQATGGQAVVYIGAADTSLKARLRLFRRSGLGTTLNHEGGRRLWQLADADDLVVAWRAMPTPLIVGRWPAEAHECSLLEDFAGRFGARPFANPRPGIRRDEPREGTKAFAGAV